MTFASLEQQKAAALARVDAWSPARLAYRPGPPAWSAVEVLDHVEKVERQILVAVQHGLSQPHRIGVRDRLGFLFLDRLFQSDRRVKVPTSAATVLPDVYVDLVAVRQRWNTTRQDLAHLLTRFPPDSRSLGVFRHPVSGWLSMPQVLRFFSVHLHHHTFQLTHLTNASDGL